MTSEVDHGVVHENDSDLLENVIENGFGTGSQIERVPEEATTNENSETFEIFEEIADGVKEVVEERVEDDESRRLLLRSHEGLKDLASVPKDLLFSLANLAARYLRDTHGIAITGGKLLFNFVESVYENLSKIREWTENIKFLISIASRIWLLVKFLINIFTLGGF